MSKQKYIGYAELKVLHFSLFSFHFSLSTFHFHQLSPSPSIRRVIWKSEESMLWSIATPSMPFSSMRNALASMSSIME